MDNILSSPPKLKLHQVKRTNWSNEVLLNSLAIDISDGGWYITCNACKDHGYPIGKHRLKMRHVFGPTGFFDHIKSVGYHKTAVCFHDSSARQASMNSFFSKKPRLEIFDHEHDDNESSSHKESSPSLPTLQDLFMSCDGIYSSKEYSSAKKVITLCSEFVKISSTSLYEFNTHKGHLCLRHKNYNRQGIHKLKGSNPFLYLCTHFHSL